MKKTSGAQGAGFTLTRKLYLQTFMRKEKDLTRFFVSGMLTVQFGGKRCIGNFNFQLKDKKRTTSLLKKKEMIINRLFLWINFRLVGETFSVIHD